MDKITKEQRSYTMSRIRSKDTKVEVRVRKHLFHLGFRYRKNDKRYPGKPDIVLPKYRTIVFVNGCFWHQHSECKSGRRKPKSNVEFWEEKFRRNKERDKRNIAQLQQDGWKVLVVWECEVNKKFEKTMEKLVKCIRSNLPREKSGEGESRPRRLNPAGFHPRGFRIGPKRRNLSEGNPVRRRSVSPVPGVRASRRRSNYKRNISRPRKLKETLS